MIGNQQYRIGWFSTGRDRAARDLLQTAFSSIQKGDIEAAICYVFSNREPGEDEESDAFFDLVRNCGIPLVAVSSSSFKEQGGAGWRPRFEQEAMRRLDAFQADLCVLAGYMLIVGEEMCRRYPMVNLHPALPGGPAGTWQEVIWQLIDQGATETGVMMHLVTPELDKGPPVTYCRFSIRGDAFDSHWEEVRGRTAARIRAEEGESNRLFQEIRRHGLAREFPLIVATMKAFAERRIRIEAGKLVDTDGKPIDTYDLTREIEERV